MTLIEAASPPNTDSILQTDESVQSNMPENLKRKAPSEDGEVASPKRARKDDDDNDRDTLLLSPPPKQENRGAEHERKKETKQEEKKRSKRLFGGLLSTLSQKPSTSQQRRRQEIEQRQQAKMQQQHAEDDVKRAERLSDQRKNRMRDQIVYEEETLHDRHDKRLELARLLKTRARPQIYYLPWRCTEEQEDIIDEQIRDAKEAIQRESRAFASKKRRHIAKFGAPSREPRRLSTHSGTWDESEHDSFSEPRAAQKFNRGTIPNRAEKPSIDLHDDHQMHDDPGDVVEEAEEDTVIY